MRLYLPFQPQSFPEASVEISIKIMLRATLSSRCVIGHWARFRRISLIANPESPVYGMEILPIEILEGPPRSK